MPPTAAATQAAEFIRAMAMAWKNLAAYPPGHPALAGAIDHVHRRLLELRGPAGEIVFGVAADGLTFGPDKIDTMYAQKFAHALYTRGVAVLRFAPTTEAKELEAFLRLLATAADPNRPIWETLTSAGVVSVNLQPVDYSGITLTETVTPEPQKKPDGSLWDEILRALVAGHELSPAGRQLFEKPARSVDELTSMILRYMREASKEQQPEFDADATFGIRMRSAPQIPEKPEAMIRRVSEAAASFVAESGGLKRQLAVQQVVQLIRALPEPIRGAVMRSVIAKLAADDKDASSLAEFAKDLPNDEILEALRYLQSMGGLSKYAVKLIESLSAIAYPAGEGPTPDNLLSDLVTLFGDEDADRFNPPDHRSLLEQVAIHVPEVAERPVSPVDRLGDRVGTITDDAVNNQMGETVLGLLERFGAAMESDALLVRAENAFHAHVATARFAEALAFLDRLHQIRGGATSDDFRAAIDASIERLASKKAIETLIHLLHSAPPEQKHHIQRLIEALGVAAMRTLMVSLAEENNRSRRRRLFDFVAGLGPSIVPAASAFLSDQRWYVVRNMILLLRAVNDRTTLPQVRDLAGHADLRVRLEAIKSLLALDTAVPENLLKDAINDPDPKLAETAIALVGNYQIKEAVDPLLEIVGPPDIFFRRKGLRILAIKALGELADPRALDALAPFFSNSILPWPAREERRAAYESLAGYPRDVRDALVTRGLTSRDPLIRALCQRLSADT
jgi:HEAT repeat protein